MYSVSWYIVMNQGSIKVCSGNVGFGRSCSAQRELRASQPAAALACVGWPPRRRRSCARGSGSPRCIVKRRYLLFFRAQVIERKLRKGPDWRDRPRRAKFKRPRRAKSKILVGSTAKAPPTSSSPAASTPSASSRTSTMRSSACSRTP